MFASAACRPPTVEAAPIDAARIDAAPSDSPTARGHGKVPTWPPVGTATRPLTPTACVVHLEIEPHSRSPLVTDPRRRAPSLW